VSAQEFVYLTERLWKWILDEGEHWSPRETAEIVAAWRVLFVACGGRIA
jgi:hypothetical protein